MSRDRRGRPGAPGQASLPHAPERRRLLSWLWRIPVLAAVAGLGYAVIEGRRVLFGKVPAADEPEFESIPPVAVAALATFAHEWDAVSFELDGTPAIALRLPEPVPGGLSLGDAHLVGFSRICTHQGCVVSLNRDPEAIALGFNFRTDSPELVCPCHLSVFSPGKGGRAVSGPAVDPLPRVRLAEQGGRLLATGIEGPSRSG